MIFYREIYPICAKHSLNRCDIRTVTSYWSLKCWETDAAGGRHCLRRWASPRSPIWWDSEWKTGCVLHKPESLNDTETQIVSSQVPPCNCVSNAAYSLLGKKKKKSSDIYAIHGTENEERGRETERAHIACGGHYFWCAPRLGELENIILSGWFDSAMKNVRSGDDKSWCWGEETGRQGMSFVMSAIWLHPPPPICLLIHVSPFLVRHNFLLFYLSRAPLSLPPIFFPLFRRDSSSSFSPVHA